MATKKTAEVKPEAEVKKPEVTKEQELEMQLKAMKAEKEALMKEVEDLKADVEEHTFNTVDMEGVHDDAYWNEKIDFYVPYFGSEDAVTVKVNGESIRVIRGETVHIKRKHAAVLINQENQRRASERQRKALQEDFDRQTKKFLG